MYLPVRFNTLYCAALRLRDLELACPLPAKQRENTPLFCMEPGVPFTHHVMTKLLLAIKDIIMHEVKGKSVFTYHSFRVLLAAQLGVSGRSGPEVQERAVQVAVSRFACDLCENTTQGGHRHAGWIAKRQDCVLLCGQPALLQNAPPSR